jgi:hypothetical protein
MDMANSTTISAERLADHFVNYLFDTYQGTRHVRRVATWIGFLLKAIENLPGAHLWQRRQRQVGFDYAGRSFKAKYNHKAGTRGGIEFVEVLPGRGQPEGDVAVQITSLDEAGSIYHDLESRLDAFISNHPR